MVTSALYGRMHISKCVKENFGFIGCSTDVLELVDAQCSGRRECSMRILDENFGNAKPCHDDLKTYLQVNYRCVKGEFITTIAALTVWNSLPDELRDSSYSGETFRQSLKTCIRLCAV